MEKVNAGLEKHQRKKEQAEKKGVQVETSREVQALKDELKALHLEEILLISKAHHIPLRRESLCRLMVDCLDDDLIYVFLLVAHDCARAHGLKEKVPGILTPLVSSVMGDLDAQSEGLEQGMFREHTRAFPWDSIDQTLLPFYWQEHSHWVLLSISWNTGTVSIYNSLRHITWNKDEVWAASIDFPVLANSVQTVKKILKALERAYGAGKDTSAFSIQLVEAFPGDNGQERHLAKQKGSIDCGVFVCWWACSLMFGTSMEMGKVEEIRAWMLAVLLFYLDEGREGLKEGHLTYQGH